MKICVVGIGRMGLPIAVALAEGGGDVVGVDIDPVRVRAVAAGAVEDDGEPGLADRVRTVLANGQLQATVDGVEAVRGCDAVVVLVRLVAGGDGIPDYAAIDAATKAIGLGLQRGTVVSFETTLPVGDTRSRFLPLLEEGSQLKAGVDFHLCFSPERVSSGSIFRDLSTYPKLVGGLTPECALAGSRLYAEHLDAAVTVMTSLESAEFAKIAETTYRDVNIALANEFARFADQVGIPMDEVVRAANSQPYSHIHQPGVGVGGHCIPVYPRFFINRADDSRLTGMARRLNEEMPEYATNRLEKALGKLDGVHVLVLGLAYRGNVPETSNSAAFPLVRRLAERGAHVRVHDAMLDAAKVAGLGLEWGALDDGWADALLLQAAHAPYQELMPEMMPGVKAVLDGRGFLDPGRWRKAGVTFVGIGR